MKMVFWKYLMVVFVFELVSSSDVLVPPCSSEIYCHGPLLHTVQMARIYEDSKTFVDMKMKYPPNETLVRFDEFMVEYHNKPTRNQVEDFVARTFESAGREFEAWVPKDWVEKPKFASKIKDVELQGFALELNKIWKKLGRKMKDEVKKNKDLYSIIWVPNPVIVPGGRFREFYYWDSYWIMLGLLLSEMVDTTRGMLENFLYMVDHYGHIPNGGRIYYLERSQPPLLIPMIKLYYDFTNDEQFLKNNIRIMEKEFEYWMTNHSVEINVDGKNYTLAHYGDRSHGPRPESYSEDVKSASNFNEAKKESFYSELKAAAESGWDFSSRWFITNGTNAGNLTNIKTRSIIPVDLNAILYWNAKLLGDFNKILGDEEKAEHYYQIGKVWLEAVTAVLWHEEVGSWLDYDMINNLKRDYFYPSNIAPLWTGCYNTTETDKITKLVIKYLHNKHIMNNPGGIPTTMAHTGEQWDYPNAWPPLQHMMVMALNNTGDKTAQRLAFEIAEKWIRSNYKSFRSTSAMLEKYDATIAGSSGGGGEYAVQEGFGWTNGVIMDLLDKYSDTIFMNDPNAEMQTNKGELLATSSSVNAVLLAVLVTLAAGFIGIMIYRKRMSQLRSSPPIPRPRVRYTELRSMKERR
ncbi:trehalase-like isoform X2 [Coccinella septempunctata]|uniref:trehalase-like isoform X2 n=2 Tax=Coccinella septempunctata TaxID=41139 RepID=UPI001D0654C3|nr:trehalase-like isoform X2 [Coccinella septempunctata]